MHKSLTNPPGRPIISGIQSSTSQLSQYLDIYLQDYVRTLPSYLKDSDHLITTIKDLEWEENSWLITMDVTALYSNIQHNIGIRCTEQYLEKDVEVNIK